MPDLDRRLVSNFGDFTKAVTKTIEWLGKAKDLIHCGYVHGTTAIGLYHDTDETLNAGAVVVVRGSVSGLTKTGGWAQKLSPLGTCIVACGPQPVTIPQPIDPCFETRTVTKGTPAATWLRWPSAAHQSP